MNKNLGKDNKTISVFLVTIGIFAYVVLALISLFWFPYVMRSEYIRDPAWYADTYVPLLIYGEIACALVAAAITVYIIICVRIGRERSFCHENARDLNRIFILLLSVSAMMIAGGFIFPKIGIVSLYITALGLVVLAFSTLAWALGKLVEHAVLIKEENDLVI